jgi:hypothetical protein
MSGTIIKTKFSTSNAAPVAGSLSTGEQAYSFNSGKLYIGDATAGTTANDLIGGSYFTDKLVHALGTLTANSAILVDGSSKIDVLNVDNITLDLNTISTTNANGHLILNPNGTGDVQVQATTLAVVGNLTVSGTTTTTGGSTLGNINIAVNTISATNTNGDIILTPNGTGDVNIIGTQTLGLPRGTDAQRPAQSTAINGAIRYNTSDNRFEGVANGAWTGLGGVVDVDQDTFITAEKTADDDHLRFMVGPAVGGTEKATVNTTGFNVDVINELTANAGILLSDNVDVGTSGVPANLTVSGNLTVEGTTTTVESTTVSITDRVMVLASDAGTTADTLERGINFKYGDGSAVQTGFFGMDMGSKRFSFQSVLGTGDTAPDDDEFVAPWGDAQFNSLFLSGNNTVTGNSIIGGLSTIGGTLGVTGVGTFSSNVTVAGTFGATGIGTFGNNITVAGTTLSTGNLTVGAANKFLVTAASGNTAIGGTLAVTGLTTVGGTLVVTGVTTLTGLLNADGGIAVDTNKFTVADATGNIVSAGTMTIAGATVLSSTLNAVAGVDFDSTLNVDGAVTHKSTTHLGANAEMKITAAGVMTHGTIDGTGVTIDCGTF